MTQGLQPPLPVEVEERCVGLASGAGRLPRDGRVELAVARRVLRSLAWARWRRRVLVGVPTALVFFFGLAAAWWAWDARTGHSRTIATFLAWSVKREAQTVPGLAQPARPWPEADSTRPVPDATQLTEPAALYRMTNIWVAHLRFSSNQWAALEPRRVEPLPHFLQPDGTALLRNPLAQRGGLAGVLGYDFDWVRAELEFGGRRFNDVGVRIKGNGTFLSSLYGDKRSFKVDLNRHVRGQKLVGLDELNFHNLVNDFSNLSDALGYEFFREAGVPAPRTAFAYLSMTVEGRWSGRPLGLYALVEPVDKAFAESRLGSRKIPIFKPVTLQLFQYLGPDWDAYAADYGLQTEATDAQRQRVIEFARLVTDADDDQWAGRVEEFLDLEEFARFLACQVLLSNYDSLLSTGQNYYLYLNPETGRLGFVPWDLDLCWGAFFLLGTTRERERASIWHPWVGPNRFLERVFELPAFQWQYRLELETLLAGLFQPERLARRMDELAGVVRTAVAAESDFRRRKFEEAIGERAADGRDDEGGPRAGRPAHQLKRFLANRARSVHEQLEGRSSGVILERRRR